MPLLLPMLVCPLVLFAIQDGLDPVRKRVGRGKGVGKSVLELEDLDGDGQRDFAVGIPLKSAVVVLSGKTRRLLQTWISDGPFRSMGTELSCAGDVNGDGVADVLVGFNPYFFTEESPYCEVRSGLDGTLLRSLAVCSNDVCVLGDLDLDGCSDLAVFLNRGFEVVSGRSGKRLAWQGDLGPRNLIWLGADRNGDGLADGIVWGRKPALLYSSGFQRDLTSRRAGLGATHSAALVFSPKARVPITRLGGKDWSRSVTRFGFIADASDLDGDGFEDVVLQDPTRPGIGLLAISWKSPEQTLFLLAPTWEDWPARLDQVVVTGIALDADRHPDFVICDARTPFALRIDARSGKDGAPLWRIILTDLGGPTFVSMTAVQDQDGDGHRDLLLGMYDPEAHGPIWEGRLQVLSGASGKVLWQMEEWDLED